MADDLSPELSDAFRASLRDELVRHGMLEAV
jgi:hypothetical protein